MSKNWTPEEIQAASNAMAAAGQPTYEKFTAEISAEDAAREKITAFAELQTDGVHFCPRCGRMSVKDRLHTNALSRRADVYICDACGNDEAIRDWKRKPIPLAEWAVAKLPTVRVARNGA